MKFLPLISVIFLSAPAAAVTYCSTRKFNFPDPHQTTDYVERFVSSQNHASLFENVPLVESMTKVSTTEWRLILRKHPVINPVMVAESLSRQLLTNARFESEEESFLPAKLAGLDESVKAITAQGLREVRVELKNPLEEKELKALLASPVGIIFPPTDLPVLDRPLVLRGLGKTPVSIITPNAISLGGVTTLKILDSGELNLKRFKDEGCKRLYYPPEQLKKEIQSKSGGAVIRASSTFLFIRLLNKISKPLNERLRAALHPDRLPSLKGEQQTNRIFSVNKLGASSLAPMKDATDLPNTFISCDHISLTPDTQKKLETEITQQFKAALGIDLAIGKTSCDRIALVKSSGDRIAVLSAIEFRTRAELEKILNCDQGVKIFGSCPTGAPEQRENEILSKGEIFPLAQIHNEFVEFF